MIKLVDKNGKIALVNENSLQHTHFLKLGFSLEVKEEKKVEKKTLTKKKSKDK